MDAYVQEPYAQTLANLRARLKGIYFDIEWSKGAAMTLEQVLDMALSQKAGDYSLLSKTPKVS